MNVNSIDQPRNTGSLDRQVKQAGLTVLTVLFALRVLGQALQELFGLRGLALDAAWDGGLLPYGLLLPAQVIILAGMAHASWRPPLLGVEAGRLLRLVGALYAAVMAARLLLGATLLTDMAWFAAWLPALFHLVLACFVILLGVPHGAKAGRP